jgi:hypothetical protein
MAKEEVDRALKIAGSYEQELVKGEDVSAEELYPEFVLHEPRGVFTPRLFSPLSVLFPFCKQVIVPINPVRDESTFRQYYGIDLKGFCHLVTEEKILPVLAASYEDYPGWYDPLFAGSHVPMNREWLMHVFSRYGSPSRAEISQDFRAWFSRLSPLREKVLQLAPDSLLRDWISDAGIQLEMKPILEEESFWSALLRGISDTGLQYLVRAAATDAMSLLSLRYDEVYDACLTLASSELTLVSLEIAAAYLAAPRLWSLDGWTVEPPEFREDLRRLSSTIRVSEGSATTFISPAMMAELSIKLGYGHPEAQDPIEFIRRIDTQDVDDNHRILVDAQSYIESGRVGKAFDKVQEARAVVKNIDREVKRISRHYKITRYGIYAAFSFLTTAGVNSLLSSIPAVEQYLMFPLFASGVPLALLATSALRTLRDNLDNLSKLLVRTEHVRSLAPYLIWKREQRGARD